MKIIYKLITCFFIITVCLTAGSNKLNINIRDTDIKDVLYMITEQSGINIVPDHTVTGKVTVNIEGVTMEEALKIIEKAYGYNFNKISENTYVVSKVSVLDYTADMKYENGLLTFDIRNADIREVLNRLSRESGLNIVMDNNVNGKISGSVKNVSAESGLAALMDANGYTVIKENGIYKIMSIRDMNGQQRRITVSVVDDKLTIEVENESVARILKEIAKNSKTDIVILGNIIENITLKITNLQLDKALEIMFQGTNLSYKKDGNTYIVSRKTPGQQNYIFSNSEIIPIKYIQAEKIPSLLPSNFPVANIKVISEQNALLVNAAKEDIDELKGYIEKLDKRVPQVSIEALIIEISQNQNDTFKTQLGLNGNYGNEIKSVADSSTGEFSYKTMGVVPEAFYAKLRMLVQKGVAKIKASPKITTINGEKAIINVGTSQYYKVTNLNNEGKEKVDYKTVDAGITLDVTPWISSSEEVNLKINSTISNVSGAPLEGPPNISKREAKTTVRIRNGETLVIGGLMQNVSTENNSGIPFISQIPLIGELFKGRNKDINQTELLIYITPKVLDDSVKVPNEQKPAKEEERKEDIKLNETIKTEGVKK